MVVYLLILFWRVIKNDCNSIYLPAWGKNKNNGLPY